MQAEKHAGRNPSIIGIGLLALDLLVQEASEDVIATAGGTCGNVMTIMASLGWRASPLARISADAAGVAVAKDLKYWNVDLRYIRLGSEAPTPIIVERLRKDPAGIPFHSFSFSCPWCGTRLPGYQAVTALSLAPVLSEVINSDVLFIDRPSRAALDLAKAATAAGMIVVFEPSSGRNEGNFTKILEYTHILKYSQDRVANAGDMGWGKQMLLEVETLGRGGLRFRKQGGRAPTTWHYLQANRPEKFLDSCGSGDWTTAGILHDLCGHGLGHLRNVPMKKIVEGLSFAQRLGSWNCEFSGARGGMYKLARSSYSAAIKRLRTSKSVVLPLDEKQRIPHASREAQLCMACDQSVRRRA